MARCSHQPEQAPSGWDNGRGKDPDAATRTGGDNIGSTQGNATAMPTNSFNTGGDGNHYHMTTTSYTPDHTHSMSGWVGSQVINYQPGPSTATIYTGYYYGSGPAGAHSHQVTITNSGAHSHAISGGDNETRPVNVAVNYIIKY